MCDIIERSACVVHCCAVFLPCCCCMCVVHGLRSCLAVTMRSHLPAPELSARACALLNKYGICFARALCLRERVQSVIARQQGAPLKVTVRKLNALAGCMHVFTMLGCTCRTIKYIACIRRLVSSLVRCLAAGRISTGCIDDSSDSIT